MKILSIDTETTGVTWQSGIHQLAAILHIDGIEVARKVWHIKPDATCTISDEALAVSGITRADLETYTPEHIFFKEFQAFLGTYVNKFDKSDKFHFRAYNAKFDEERLRDLWKRRGDNYFGSWFWTPVNCVMIAAGRSLGAVRHNLMDFKLHTVCKYMGISWDEAEAHDALYDIKKTIELDEHLNIQ
jgi:DNA polymerase-3 subunit epsilon